MPGAGSSGFPALGPAMADVSPEQAQGLVPITRHGIGTRLGERLAIRIGTAARR
ncbi:hypothetical protein ABZV14_35490 [Streptosporangium canum]|uniref:hypothetical protein n=1 Tax=Streptosporangium canum TaxID=324952 RepID=UPI0033A3F01E